MMKDFLQAFKIKILQIIIIIFVLQQINSYGSISNCQEYSDYFFDSNCFNNIILLDTCSSGQFANDKYGNLFILYTLYLDNNRLLYGLKKDGTYYFPNMPAIEYKINDISD